MKILAEAAVAFLITYLVTPILIRKLRERGIVGADVHKSGKPLRAEMGGLAVLIGFAGAFLFASLISVEVSYRILPVFLTIILAGFIGVLDDLVNLRQRYKPFLVALMSTPLIVANADRIGLWFPSFGWVHFGSLYLVLIPLAVATASNLTNMFAGFNGLEAGVGSISCFSLGFLLAVLERWDSAALAFSLSAAFLAFLFYNWYPAKIFPGDTGTLVSGAAVAAISISGGVEVAGIVMMIPSAIDFTLKMLARNPFSGRKRLGDTMIAEDGTLVSPGYAALAHAFMNVTRIKEKDLVFALLLMQALYSFLAVFMVLFFK